MFKACELHCHQSKSTTGANKMYTIIFFLQSIYWIIVTAVNHVSSPICEEALKRKETTDSLVFKDFLGVFMLKTEQFDRSPS